MALVVFDIDGTLFDGQEATVPAVRGAFRAFGLPVPAAAAIRALIGSPARVYEQWLADRCPPSVDRAGVVAETNRLELRFVRDRARLYDGVVDMLETLAAAGHVMAVCTNGHAAYVGEVLNVHGLAHYFRAVELPSGAPGGKPAMVRRILHAIPARPFVTVGDRAEDIAAGRENGGGAVGAAYGYGTRQDLAAAHALIERPLELPGVLEEVLERLARD